MLNPKVEAPNTFDDVSKALLESRENARNGVVTDPPVIATAGQNPPAPPAPIVPPAAAVTPAPAFDEVSWLKEKSGGKFESWESLWTAANKPPETRIETAMPTFPNDTSKKIYEALVSGKELEVLPFLQNRKLATDISTMPAEDKVRMHLKAEYGLTDTQVEREYNKLYVPTEDASADPMDIEIEKKKAARRLSNDAATAEQYFAKRSEEIKLPFNAPPAAAPAQLTAEQVGAIEFGQSYNTDKVSSFPFEFNEQQKGIAVKGTTTLPADEIAKIKAKISVAPEQFLAGLLMRWYTPDQQVNVDAVARDAYYLDNPSAIASNIAKDALEQTFFQRLQQEKYTNGKNITGGPFMDIAETDREGLYKLARIPATKAGPVSAPQG